MALRPSMLARLPASLNAAAAAAASRNMSVQAFLEPFPNVSSPVGGAAEFGGVERTELPNGVVVMSQDTGGLAASAAVVIGAGTRCETMATAGTARTLKEIAFGSTEDKTAFKILREAEANSTVYSSSCDRASISYEASFLRGNMDAPATIAECVVSPALNSWEVERVAPIIGRSTVSEAESAINDVYTAAFRSTAGQGSEVPAARVGAVSADDVASWRDAYFTGANTVAVGVDVAHDEFVAAVSASLSALPAGAGASCSALAYTGGEVRTTVYGPQTSFAFAVEGAAAGSSGALPAAVAKMLMGGEGSALTWGTDSTASQVGAALGRAVSQQFSIRGFGDSYTDGGIVGFSATVASEEAAEAVLATVAAAKEILAGNFGDEDVARAKNQLRASVLGAGKSGRIATLAASAAGHNAFATPEAVSAAISNVSTADVKAACAAMSASSPSYSVRGNTDVAPYLSDL
eukprot:UC1_evm5s313